MSRARRAAPQGKHRGGWILGAAVAAAVAIAGVAVAGQLGTENEPGAGTGPQPTSSVLDAASGPSAEPTPTPTPHRDSGAGACTQELAATEAVVNAARVAAGHWREHVQARTDLLTGKNTEATTKAIWKRTRLAGPADTANLSAATTALQRVKGGCANYTGPAASPCRQRLAALDTAVASGRAASADWAAHLAMMRAHASGDFGAEHAQHLWVTAWQSAPKNLDAFAQATTTLAEAPACRPT